MPTNNEAKTYDMIVILRILQYLHGKLRFELAIFDCKCLGLTSLPVRHKQTTNVTHKINNNKPKLTTITMTVDKFIPNKKTLFLSATKSRFTLL